MPYIFISYSRADKACAYKIQRQLEAQGFKIWIDKDAIPAGAPFPTEILQAIRSAAAVMILWSQHADKSHFVGKEIEEALNQKMMRSMPVIPIWLDNTPLRPELETLNAIHLSNCSDSEIDGLNQRLAPFCYRRLLDFDPEKALSDQGAVKLKQSPALAALPILESVYCKGRIVAPPSTSLASAKSHPARTVQVYLEFLGKVGSEDSISKIYETLQASQPDVPFFLFHFTGHEVGTDYSLIDDPADSPSGDWLDPVNAIHHTLETLIGRGGATLQLFNAVPASLNFALGMKFFKYWQLQLYHYTRDRRYQYVLDTTDL